MREPWEKSKVNIFHQKICNVKNFNNFGCERFFIITLQYTKYNKNTILLNYIYITLIMFNKTLTWMI